MQHEHDTFFDPEKIKRLSEVYARKEMQKYHQQRRLRALDHLIDVSIDDAMPPGTMAVVSPSMNGPQVVLIKVSEAS
jgi:hypothetical protein